MATNMRTALAGAVVSALAAALPSMTVQRGRRAPVSEKERPLILVETADAVPDDAMSPGETFWWLGFSVNAFIRTERGSLTADQADVACEDALGEVESAIVAALHAQALTTPDGTLPLTCGIQPHGSSIEIADAASAAMRLGTVSVDFRAQLVLPVGVTSFP